MSFQCRRGGKNPLPPAATNAVGSSAIKGQWAHRIGISSIALAVFALAGCSTSQGPKNAHGLSTAFNGYLQSRSSCKVTKLDVRGRRTTTRHSRQRVLRVPTELTSIFIKAARQTGVSANYLAVTASRESGFRQSVKAKTSSAVGLFQFVDQTWLRLLAADGHCHGLGHLSRHIVRNRKGRFVVLNVRRRKQILSLRRSASISALMAGRLTQRNARSLRARTQRHPSYNELYVAHFLGAGSAARLVNAVRQRPRVRADTLFRNAARTNPRIFYSNGRARTVHAVYRELTKSHTSTKAVYTRPRRSLIGRAWSRLASN